MVILLGKASVVQASRNDARLLPSSAWRPVRRLYLMGACWDIPVSAPGESGGLNRGCYDV